MFRIFSRGRNVPLEHPPCASGHSLHQAKVGAWSIAVGESSPAADPPYRMHRHHRGMLDDLPLPQAPERAPLLSLRAIIETIAQAVALGGSPATGTAALSAASNAPGGKSAKVTYIESNGGRESRLPADATDDEKMPRAA